MAFISCTFHSLHCLPKSPTIPRISLPSPPKTRFLKLPLLPSKIPPPFPPFATRTALHIRHSTLNRQNPNDPILETESPAERIRTGDGNVSNEGDSSNWTTSILLFAMWAGLLYYVFALTPNQTPYRDTYFLQKLLNLKGDDGFHMNEVLVSLWYIMGLWPLAYSMLLLPTGRSSRSKIPVWPFLVLSMFGGAYALIPYFVLWRPPSPALDEAEVGRWPLNFLESKITSGILLAAGLGIIAYASLASDEVWKEFYQYFRESKFIHITCIDFTLLSAFAPFWVYNDMTIRKWAEKGSWLVALALVPFLGPAFYLFLRPPLPVGTGNATNEV